VLSVLAASSDRAPVGIHPRFDSEQPVQPVADRADIAACRRVCACRTPWNSWRARGNLGLVALSRGNLGLVLETTWDGCCGAVLGQPGTGAVCCADWCCAALALLGKRARAAGSSGKLLHPGRGLRPQY